jgi:hypothetical protein
MEPDEVKQPNRRANSKRIEGFVTVTLEQAELVPRVNRVGKTVQAIAVTSKEPSFSWESVGKPDFSIKWNEEDHATALFFFLKAPVHGRFQLVNRSSIIAPVANLFGKDKREVLGEAKFKFSSEMIDAPARQIGDQPRN